MSITLQKRFILYYLPIILWCGVIFFLSSQSKLPGPDTFVLDFLFKKSAHMFVYGVLYWLLFRAVNVERQEKIFLLPLLFCLLYAVTDEVHQSLTPGRTPTLRDIGYDFLGMSVVLLRLRGLV